ncbi:hypothetical protein C5167_016284 [Papaver somniferum]|nr:hypothetical protein C5167_016284 [Papaver somniferum]
MEKQFNVPPVVFPSGSGGLPQQRRAPTTVPPPFQPPRPANNNLPFMSFDVGSAVPSTSFSNPVFGANSGTIGGYGSGFDDELPLLEELGINTRQIWKKSTSILNPFRINPNLHEDADLSGPFLFLMAFGLFQLLAGKLHFGILLGWVTVASLFLYVVFNMLAGKNGNLDLYRCLSLIGYCMLPMVILSAFALFLPQGGVIVMGMAGVFVLWSTRLLYVPDLMRLLLLVPQQVMQMAMSVVILCFCLEKQFRVGNSCKIRLSKGYKNHQPLCSLVSSGDSKFALPERITSELGSPSRIRSLELLNLDRM